MKALKLSSGVLLAAAIVVPLAIQHRAEANLRAKEEARRQQASRLAALLAENGPLSNAVAEAKSSQSLSDEQLMELLRLRNEVGQLKWALQEKDHLQREMRRIRDGLQDLAKEKERGGDNSTTRLADEMELRRARVAQFKQWLEETSGEKIPELQLLSEESWVRSADRPRITDEEYRLWISAQRGNAQGRFAHMAFQALKQFTQANSGQFPTRLSQLKPYFESPVDDAILQRWEIVPPKTLIKFLTQAGGDWVITEKAPVNKKYDSRHAIGRTDWRGTLEEGRWDPVR